MRRKSTPTDPTGIRLLQYTAFVSTLDRFAIPPMFVAIATALGAPLSQVVQAAGTYFLAYGLMQPVWGMISDRLGIVHTLRLTLFFSAASTAMSAFAWDPLSLGLFRCLAGAFFGAALPSALIYIGDTVPAERRQAQVTRLMVGLALGTALASVGAGALAHFVSWRLVFLGTGVAAVALAIALRGLPEPQVRRRHRNLLVPLVRVSRSTPTLLVLALTFVEGAVVLGALTLLPPAVEATGVSSTVAGAVAGVYGVAVLGFAPLVGELSATQRPSRLIGLGGTAAIVGCTMMAVSQQPSVAVVVAALLGLAWAAMHSSLQTWATEVLPSIRATVISLFASSLFVGNAVGAVLVADLAESGRYRETFLLAAATAVPLAVAATWARARWRGTDPGA